MLFLNDYQPPLTPPSKEGNKNKSPTFLTGDLGGLISQGEMREGLFQESKDNLKISVELQFIC